MEGGFKAIFNWENGDGTARHLDISEGKDVGIVGTNIGTYVRTNV